MDKKKRNYFIFIIFFFAIVAFLSSILFFFYLFKSRNCLSSGSFYSLLILDMILLIFSLVMSIWSMIKIFKDTEQICFSYPSPSDILLSRTKFNSNSWFDRGVDQPANALLSNKNGNIEVNSDFVKFIGS